MNGDANWSYWAVLSVSFAALTAIFALLLPGERPALREWVGKALVAACVLVLSLKR